MDVLSLRVAGLVYDISFEAIGILSVSPDGVSELHTVSLVGLLQQIEMLKSELRDGKAIQGGYTPKLKAFMTDWGRQLLPPWVSDNPLDILVIVPRGMIHDIPLHLVRINDGRTLGSCCGFTFVSSMSLFGLCCGWNRARAVLPPESDSRVAESEHRKRNRTFQGLATDVVRGKDDLFKRLLKEVSAVFEVIAMRTYDPGICTKVEWKYALESEVAGPASADVIAALVHGIVDPNDHRLSGLLFDREGIGQHLHGVKGREATVAGFLFLLRKNHCAILPPIQ